MRFCARVYVVGATISLILYFAKYTCCYRSTVKIWIAGLSLFTKLSLKSKCQYYYHF
ncbi:GSCOCG00005393001-RA-CDS [Cotesia congregata]|nr:GSCOCG00005393001-RA-CDS [Cotesia congregata]